MRFFGLKGGGRRRRLFILGTLLVSTAALAALMVSNALAVHETGAFELDGNAVSANAPAPFGPADDWDRVCFQYANPLPTGGCGTTTKTTGSTSGTWQADGANATIFTGGGSKDPIDLSSWQWKNGAAPGKDDLLHAFAARYSLSPNAQTCPAGTFPTCEVIFFGMDRFDNSGDAQNGFWFFKSKIGLVSGKTNTFSGVHQNGDILVVSDFSIGGTVSTITVYKWDTACTATGKPDASCADSNLRQLETSTAAKCASPPLSSSDDFCGIVNPTGGTPAPWSGDYTDKSGNHSYLQGELYEAGLNLSTLGLAGECFSSMVAESRSSTSTSSTLQDFVLANFPNCKPQLSTQASNEGTVLPGTAVHDTATITVTGGTNPPDPTGTVTFFLCGPNASNPTCTSGGTNIGTGSLANQSGGTTTDGIAVAGSPDVNTASSKLAPGFYCFRATWPGDTNYPGGIANADNTGECFRVQDTSSVSSAQHWVPNDTATARSDNGTPLNGTLTAQLYTGTDCVSGNEVSGHLYTNTVSNNTTSDTITLTTTNTDEFDSSVSWLVTFTSSDAGVASPSSSHCENSSLTVTN